MAITINNGVTIGPTYTAPNYVASNFELTATSVSLANIGLSLTMDITQSSTPPFPGHSIVLYWAFSDNASLTYPPSINYDYNIDNPYSMTMILDGIASSTKSITSAMINPTNQYLYTWIKIPDSIGNSVTMTLTLNTIGNTGLSGNGSPQGVVSAIPGATYIDSSTGNFWVKQTGNGNTGWLLIVSS